MWKFTSSKRNWRYKASLCILPVKPITFRFSSTEVGWKVSYHFKFSAKVSMLKAIDDEFRSQDQTTGLATHGQTSPEVTPKVYVWELASQKSLFQRKFSGTDSGSFYFPSWPAQMKCPKQHLYLGVLCSEGGWSSMPKLTACSVAHVWGWSPQAWRMLPAIVGQGNRASEKVELSLMVLTWLFLWTKWIPWR